MSAHAAPPHSSSSDMSEAQWRLPHGPRSPKRARDLLRSQLAEWKIDGEVAFTAELLLSELVTNALLHARMPAGREIGVRVARYDEHLRVEVADANNSRPELRTATATDEHGRGLALVDALAQRWGCCPRRHGIGKATWAELPLLPGGIASARTTSATDGTVGIATQSTGQPRCVGANIRSTAGSTSTDGPGSDRAFVRSVSKVSGDVRTPGTPNDSANAT